MLVNIDVCHSNVLISRRCSPFTCDTLSFLPELGQLQWRLSTLRPQCQFGLRQEGPPPSHIVPLLCGCFSVFKPASLPTNSRSGPTVPITGNFGPRAANAAAAASLKGHVLSVLHLSPDCAAAHNKCVQRIQFPYLQISSLDMICDLLLSPVRSNRASPAAQHGSFAVPLSSVAFFCCVFRPDDHATLLTLFTTPSMPCSSPCLASGSDCCPRFISGTMTRVPRCPWFIPFTCTIQHSISSELTRAGTARSNPRAACAACQFDIDPTASDGGRRRSRRRRRRRRRRRKFTEVIFVIFPAIPGNSEFVKI